MKKLFILICAVLVVCSLVGCQQDMNAAKHSITMYDEDWLFEKIPSSARVGDTVTVKISKAFDVGYMFMMNGEEIEMEDDTDKYWLFTFTMPDEDVEIDFNTYDGFLPDINYGKLIETFWKQNPEAEYVRIREYYGEYESGAIVAMIDWCDYTSNEWCEEIAGCEFRYGNGNCLQVLHDDSFYKLPTAYEKGILTEDDIQEIHEQYVSAHKDAYTENE